MSKTIELWRLSCSTAEAAQRQREAAVQNAKHAQAQAAARAGEVKNAEKQRAHVVFRAKMQELEGRVR